MKSAVTFTSVKFPVPQFETESEGRDIAVYLIEGLSRAGFEIERRGLVAGEGGWNVWFESAGRKWRMFLNSSGLGAPIVDHWTAWFTSVGTFFGLFGGTASPEDAVKVRTSVDTLLRELPAENVRWWDPDELTDAILNK